MSKTYALTEIFYTLQGEGFWTGTPAVFVRFAGCNLKCGFCDTDFSLKFMMTAEEILAEVDKYPTDRIIFTGGEPFLQLDSELINLLKDNWKVLHVETNGTIMPPKMHLKAMNFVTVSPKAPEWLLKQGDEIKVVYEGQDLKPFELSAFKHWFLQPCSESNIMEVVEICKKNPKWRLSLQTQKMIAIP